MAKRSETSKVDPKPKREDFDRVLKALVSTPPVTREEVHKKTSKKRHKKSGKVLDAEIINSDQAKSGR